MSKKIIIKGNRLMWYTNEFFNDYWTDHWKRSSYRDIYLSSKRNKLMNTIFNKYYSRNDIILEIGCGLAQWVQILYEKGCNAIGLDLSVETINSANKNFPELPLLIGNALHLPFRNNSLDGAISLGLVEHFFEGPERSLKAAHKAVKKGGFLLISVPYINWLRKLKKMLKYYPSHEFISDDKFYQYAFNKKEFMLILKKQNFNIIDVIEYGAAKGLKDEISFIKKLYIMLINKNVNKKSNNNIYGYKKKFKIKLFNSSFIRTFFNFKILRKMTGHMILFIVKI